MSKFPSFLKLNNIPLDAYTIFCLSIYDSVYSWVASTSCLLWIMLLWTWVYKYLSEFLLSGPLDIYPEVELLAVMVVVQSLSRVWLLRRHGLWLARLLCPWYSPGKNTGLGCNFLLQGIFPIQGSKSGLSHCRQILYQLSYRTARPYHNSIFNFFRNCHTIFHILTNTCYFLFFDNSHHDGCETISPRGFDLHFSDD